MAVVLLMMPSCAGDSATPQAGSATADDSGSATPRDGSTPTADSTGSTIAREADDDAEAQAQTAGFRGRVLRGPLAGGPLVGDQPDEGPFSATFSVTDADGVEVARFQSDDEGLFELLIAPGDYLIVAEPSAPVFRPAEQQHAVTVPPGEIVELTLRFDTGMR